MSACAKKTAVINPVQASLITRGALLGEWPYTLLECGKRGPTVLSRKLRQADILRVPAKLPRRDSEALVPGDCEASIANLGETKLKEICVRSEVYISTLGRVSKRCLKSQGAVFD
jgi:hypothetical protein